MEKKSACVVPRLVQVPEWRWERALLGAGSYRAGCPGTRRGLRRARGGNEVKRMETREFPHPDRQGRASSREGAGRHRSPPSAGSALPLRSGGAGQGRPPQEMAGGRRRWGGRTGRARRYLSALTGGLRSRMTATAAAPLAYCAMPSARDSPRRLAPPAARPPPPGRDAQTLAPPPAPPRPAGRPRLCRGFDAGSRSMVYPHPHGHCFTPSPAVRRSDANGNPGLKRGTNVVVA